MTILRTPWNSIAESVIPLVENQRNFTDARQSPCATCATSPCCTYLPLHNFKVRNMMELDHAIYLLNFDHIELGLSSDGNWSVYYRYPCRFLNRETFACTIHNTPQQPQICINYNPYTCWYKRVLTHSINDEFLRIDRQRMEWIVEHTRFDELRNIVEVPDWLWMLEEIARLPPTPPASPAPPPTSDPIEDAWKSMVINLESIPSKGSQPQSYGNLSNPCDSCAAYCCTTLVFPQSRPAHISSLDHLRFCLGFPGVELGISDGTWSLAVKTTCRHLQGNRCGVFGQAERPLICRYYDAWKCTYRPNFGQPRPENFLRLKLDQFDWLAECFQFDNNGAIVEHPPTATIRNHIEQRLRTV
ncbi:MAG: hypothetical protein SH847_15205 [Roseiflexaceae bacterium]|nr:hypothetical protein [Roseiflexaceae bacterium]